MLPSSRFALSLKPNVAYLVLNFAADWKWQTTLSSLAYAGIPYQSLGVRPGAVSLMMAWSRLAMVRSGSRISAIFASTALSPSLASLHLLDAVPYRASFLLGECLAGRIGALGGLLRALLCKFHGIRFVFFRA